MPETEKPADTGDVAHVPDEQQVEHDEPEPNEDATDDLADVEDGDVADVETPDPTHEAD